MPDASDIQGWPEKIRQRYENYLKTSFFYAWNGRELLDDGFDDLMDLARRSIR